MIPFISSRIQHIESYVRELDSRISNGAADRVTQKEKEIEGKFGSLLNNLIETGREDLQNSQIQVQVASPLPAAKDNLAKLPEGFDKFLEDTTAQMSEKFGVEIPANLVKSVIKQESGFNPTAVSSAGAQGLMQLMPETARSVGVFNSMNPYQNAQGGIKYLGMMMQKFNGNVQHALAAYNAGPGAVEKYGGIPPYKETKNYVQSIMADFLKRENYAPIDVTG